MKFNFNSLEGGQYTADSAKDYDEIMKALNQEIELTVDRFGRVWTEGGIYIADVTEMTMIK